MPETHLKRNLWTEMTGITTVEEYERLYGPGSFQRDYKEQQECARRIHDRLRFHIGPDGKTYESRFDGLYEVDPIEALR